MGLNQFRHAKGGILFIDEAINTIVQEMENNRDDTIVIFAVYPDKMERFLDFPDYTPQELLDILHLMVSQTDNFGNGRFVRNLLEQAQIKQASRVMQAYSGKEIDRHILLELKKEDFDVNVVKQYKSNNS